MTLRLTTGDRVPVDGEITQGEAWFDEAMLTGEPVPQEKVMAMLFTPGRWYRTVPFCSAPAR